jgi:hypothetical protein
VLGDDSIASVLNAMKYSSSVMAVAIVAFCVGLHVQAAPVRSFLEQSSGSLVKAHLGLQAWEAPTMGKNTTQLASLKALECGKTHKVDEKTNKYDKCPVDCPFFAQNRKDDEHCTFLCVPAMNCDKWNPNKPIPDEIKGTLTCRGPMVQFCNTPVLDGTDRCKKCQAGWRLWEEDGQCYFKHWTAIITGVSIFGGIFFLVAVWIVEWCQRPTINAEAVNHGHEFRSRAKILQPKKDGHSRKPWPLNTNLTKEDVAGPGLMLHFNFQAHFIAWPLFVAIVWTVLACFHNELFILGTRRFGTPRHNCALVAWGYTTQQRLMWTKVLFLAIVYVVSCVWFMIFHVQQHRTYARMDAETKTMRDFAVELEGLPPIKGNEDAEGMILQAVADAGCVNVLGVSIVWDFQPYEDQVMAAVKKDQMVRAGSMMIEQPEDPTEGMGAFRKRLYKMESSLLGYGGTDTDEDANVKELIEGISCTACAFVVFNTESDRDAALDKSVKLNYENKDYELSVTEVHCEPMTVNWNNFGDLSYLTLIKNFCYGFWVYYMPALAIWFFIFYVPYAWSLYNFNYDNGAELPAYYGLVFTMIVVGGNATMYFVCDLCCDKIGFKYKDTKQVCYVLMYLAACMVNVVLDMVVTYWVAMKVMIGLDFRTYHGTRLADIKTYTEQFETYAMQRSLGENVYRYSWPSTFLVPFLLEPIITIYIPYQLGKLIVRTHKEVTKPDSEAFFAAFDLDLGRYADILLNVFLGILMFWFPGGYTWTLFYGMAFSHCVIYAFDHWRVLQVIPNVRIVTDSVDWWAQVVLAGCCAMILSALVFKANCETYAHYCIQDIPLIEACTVAGTAHFVVHFLLLVFVVPKFVPNYKADIKGEETTFAEVARNDAFTWFAVNPVHCLRSQHLAGHTPHCGYASVGKEHLMEINEAIHCYFKDDPAASEIWDVSENVNQFKSFAGEHGSMLSRKFTRTRDPEETENPEDAHPKTPS